MSNASYYQRHYWFSKIAVKQHGEFCAGCGISKGSNWNNRHFTGLIVDKINNDGNHTIQDNDVKDFQLLCIACNRIKNHVSKPDESEKTQSEKTNLRAEKPLMEWLFNLLKTENKIIKFDWFVAEGSFKFDISPETIERRYYKKYFKSDSSPFTLDMDQYQNTIIVLRKQDKPQTNLDIDTTTPTPLSKIKKTNET